MKHNFQSTVANTPSEKVSSDRWNDNHVFIASDEPADPAPGVAIPWMSNGVGYGDAGDIIIKINVAGDIRYCVCCDFSALGVANVILSQGGDYILTQSGDTLLNQAG